MSQPETAVRIVTAADAAVLDRLADDVFDHPVQPALLAAFLANPSNLLAVALSDEVVVGMASGIAYVHPDKPLQLFVNEVGVSARFHRRGIGTRLLRALLEHARALGCTEAWVVTEDENRAARALYGSIGGVEQAERAAVFEFALADARATDGDSGR
ncbi:MAG: GNAT family N-acetyltransferase [Trueperaceae bacterium]|nr:MAG: GNAT family N-acetyltransferase [Trueperaceae bacterium]